MARRRRAPILGRPRGYAPPGMASSRLAPTPSTLLLVAAGGGLGAGLRHLLTEVAEPSVAAGLPWATLGVNLLGAALLGAVVALRGRWPVWTGPALATGTCGALTTFSTFAVEVVEMARVGRTAVAGLYAVLTVGGAIAAVAAGQRAVSSPASP